MIRLHKVYIFLVILWLICDSLALQADTARILTCSHDKLLFYRTSLLCNSRPVVVLPSELWTRKRGRRRRGGIRGRIRKCLFKPPLPSIILSNVHSLWNKMDHPEPPGKGFQGHLHHRPETWLDESVSDVEVHLDNFTIIRSDRSRQSGKMQGCDVISIYINSRWCSNIKVHSKVCMPYLEMLTLSLRPYHLPQEFPNIVVSCVYIGLADHNVISLLPLYKQELKLA